MKYLINHKIISQQHYIPIYKFSIYKSKKSSFPGSEQYFRNSVSIPIYVSLKNRSQKKIINLIKNYIKKSKQIK